MYINGKIANEDNLTYTQPPWSRNKPEESSSSSSSVGAVGSDDSDRVDTSAGKFSSPEENLSKKYAYLEDNQSISTNTLAGNHNMTTGENRMALLIQKVML